VLRQQTTSRKAFLLYGTLLVLPTLIFGVLYWRELQKDFQRQSEAVPQRAQDGADRIVNRMQERLTNLVVGESRRSFYQYAEVISPEDALGDDLALQPSPLVKAPMPSGILGWFSVLHIQGSESRVQTFVGSDVPERERALQALEPVVADFLKRADKLESLSEIAGAYFQDEVTPVPLTALVVNLVAGVGGEPSSVKEVGDALRGHVQGLRISDFRLQFYLDRGEPRAIASRRIMLSDGPALLGLPADAPCLRPLIDLLSVQQGFVLDVAWLFRSLPFELAAQLLDQDEELRVPPAGLPFDSVGSIYAEIYPVTALGFDTYYPGDQNYGRLEVQAFTERMDERNARQARGFLATGFMLLLTLGTGMTLLYRSVRRELDQAHRMQNFVAAVTHELRTPISTIRLHAEMLMDGWVDDAKHDEYYRRIVRETHRLSTLVERVLEKSRLKENVTRPVVGDLNEHVAALRDDLQPPESEPQDLAFQLEPKLPHVWLTAEGVGMIVSNLVENARKYAPARDEPILVRTRWAGGSVLLEVLDRGPGVPAAEREKIFEAFYRVGSEQTRTTTGTGLGLHLVRLHAETCHAQASVEEREGGGSVFRVAFRPAD